MKLRKVSTAKRDSGIFPYVIYSPQSCAKVRVRLEWKIIYFQWLSRTLIRNCMPMIHGLVQHLLETVTGKVTGSPDVEFV